MVSARSKKWGLNERTFFSKKELAISHAKSIEERLVKFGKESEVPKEKIVLADRFQGLTVQLAHFGKSPEDAVTHYIQHLGNEALKQAKPFIRDLADSWETFKLADTTLSERYLSEIHSYAIFIKRKWGDKKPDEIKRNDIDLLLKKLKIRQIFLSSSMMRMLGMNYRWCLFSKPIG
jgi:hypothetical protein